MNHFGWSLLYFKIIDLTDLMAKALDVKVGLQAVSAGMLPLPPTYKF